MYFTEQRHPKSTGDDLHHRRVVQQRQVGPGAFALLANQEYNQEFTHRSGSDTYENARWIHHLQQDGAFLQYQEYAGSATDDGGR